MGLRRQSKEMLGDGRFFSSFPDLSIGKEFPEGPLI